MSRAVAAAGLFVAITVVVCTAPATATLDPPFAAPVSVASPLPVRPSAPSRTAAPPRLSLAPALTPPPARSSPPPVAGPARVPGAPAHPTFAGVGRLAPAPPTRPPVPRFAGPVVRTDGRDLPDPFVLHVGTTWWVYATGAGRGNLQVAASPDLRSWGPSSDPLPTLPAWAAPGFTWAPAVLHREGRYVLYYTVRDAALGRQCISAAVARGPAGPFVDASTGPMICQATNGGSIDPNPFAAPDGTPYLLWKTDDNALGTRARIGGQRLSDDGLSLVGPRPALLSATARWEGGVVEGPTMVAAGERYYLFYGANHWDTPGAGIGYAVCATPLGPCANDSSARPWLATQGAIVGPSGPDLFTDGDGVVHLAFHAWAPGPSGTAVRALWTGTLVFAA